MSWQRKRECSAREAVLLLKTTKLLETPASREVLMSISSIVPESAEPLYSDGRLFMGRELVGKGYPADEKRYAALAFGVK